MKRLLFACFTGMALMVLSGCDWTSGGGADGYNSRYSWADFSGVYRGFNGGLLVTDYSTTPGVPGVTNSFPDSYNVGVGDGSRRAFDGTLRNKPVVPGSLTISAGSITLVDNGSGSFSGPAGASGSINYGTGAWAVDFGFPLDDGVAIRATYSYTVSSSGTSGGGASSGASGIDIFSFTVFQQGENITVTDNNGSEYVGKLGNTQVSDSSNSTSPSVGTSVIMQFSLEGVSAAGFTVTMVGTFQGVVQDSSGSQLALADRRMIGTWIEDGGTTGDINGSASPIAISVVASDTTSDTTSP